MLWFGLLLVALWVLLHLVLDVLGFFVHILLIAGAVLLVVVLARRLAHTQPES